MTNQSKAVTIGILVALCWSTVAAFFKLSLSYLNVWQLLFYSCLASLVTLFIVLLTQGKLKQLFLLTKKEYYWMFFLGLLNPLLYFICLFKSYDYLPAQEAQAITYTWPIMMVVLGFFMLNQKITKRDYFTFALCYLGIFIVITKGDIFSFKISSWIGIFYAITSTIIWALYWTLNTKSKSDPVVALFLNSLFSFPFIILIMLFNSDGIGHIYGILSSIYVGVFEMGIAFVGWIIALKLAEKKSQVISLAYISPVLSLFFIQIITGEKIIMSSVIGIVTIIIGLSFQKKTA